MIKGRVASLLFSTITLSALQKTVRTRIIKKKWRQNRREEKRAKQKSCIYIGIVHIVSSQLSEGASE